eukprot:232321_1
MSESYMIIIVILCSVLQTSRAMYRPKRPWYCRLVSCCTSGEQTIEEQSTHHSHAKRESSNTDSSQNPLSHSYSSRSRSLRSSDPHVQNNYDSGLSATNYWSGLSATTYLSGLNRLATSVLHIARLLQKLNAKIL